MLVQQLRANTAWPHDTAAPPSMPKDERWDVCAENWRVRSLWSEMSEMCCCVENVQSDVRGREGVVDWGGAHCKPCPRIVILGVGEEALEHGARHTSGTTTSRRSLLLCAVDYLPLPSFDQQGAPSASRAIRRQALTPSYNASIKVTTMHANEYTCPLQQGPCLAAASLQW